MQFQLNSEQREIQEAVRRMVDREINPILARNDPDRPLPKEDVKSILQICATQGLTSARVPESAGGAGMPRASEVISRPSS